MKMIQRLINHQIEYVFLQITPLKVAVWKIPRAWRPTMEGVTDILCCTCVHDNNAPPTKLGYILLNVGHIYQFDWSALARLTNRWYVNLVTLSLSRGRGEALGEIGRFSGEMFVDRDL